MIETYDDLFVKKCLRCQTPTPENREVDDIYCEKCASPLVNRCTNESHDSFSNDGHCGITLKPEAVYCKKCATISLFASKGLIDNEYPEVEIVIPYAPPDEDDLLY